VGAGLITLLIVLAVVLLVCICRAFTDDWMEAGFVGFCVIIGLVVVGLIYGGIDYVQGPDLATLKKSEWYCSDSHSETTYVMSGKVLVPITSDVCDEYSRVGHRR
jgi:hypothetical protein